MNDSQIKDRVLALKEALAQHGVLDPALIDALRDLERDIRALTANPVGLAVEGHSPDLPAQLLAIEAKLEAEHPVLISTLRQASDALGKMGL